MAHAGRDGQGAGGRTLAHLRQTSRDHARTPMQWSADAQGGFTTGTPWLAVNPNYAEINAAIQLENPDSVFHHHRRLIELRRQLPALVHGAFLDLDPEHQTVFVYTRTLGDARLLVVIHFGREALAYVLPGGLAVGECVLDNVGLAAASAGSTTLRLAPWQASVYRLA